MIGHLAQEIAEVVLFAEPVANFTVNDQGFSRNSIALRTSPEPQ
jgi:hypothetical protein